MGVPVYQTPTWQMRVWRGGPQILGSFLNKIYHTMGPPKIFGVLSTPLLNSYIAPDLTLLVQKLKSSMKEWLEAFSTLFLF